jgi:hypothetical protein
MFENICLILMKTLNPILLQLIWFISISQLRKFDFVEENFPAYDQDLMKKADGFLVDIALYDDHCETARNKYKVIVARS